MRFEILDYITNVKQIAVNKQTKTIARLQAKYGNGRWRKLKGLKRVRLENGKICHAEIHWYEANGIGKKDFKIKRFFT